MAVGGWHLAAGSWRLAVGDWLFLEVFKLRLQSKVRFINHLNEPTANSQQLLLSGEIFKKNRSEAKLTPLFLVDLVYHNSNLP